MRFFVSLSCQSNIGFIKCNLPLCCNHAIILLRHQSDMIEDKINSRLASQWALPMSKNLNIRNSRQIINQWRKRTLRPSNFLSLLIWTLNYQTMCTLLLWLLSAPKAKIQTSFADIVSMCWWFLHVGADSPTKPAYISISFLNIAFQEPMALLLPYPSIVLYSYAWR